MQSIPQEHQPTGLQDYNAYKLLRKASCFSHAKSCHNNNNNNNHSTVIAKGIRVPAHFTTPPLPAFSPNNENP